MTERILEERVLSDNTLLQPDKGKKFKGGYIAIVIEYEFANSWADKQLPPKNFRSLNSLSKFLKKHYPNFIL